MEHRVQIVVNGGVVVDVEDCDESAIHKLTRLFSDAVEKYGLKHAVTVFNKIPGVQEAAMSEARCDRAHLSTVVM